MANPVFISYGWNRKYVPCGGTEKLYLLVELTVKASPRQPERTPAAQNVRIKLKPVGHVQITHIFGHQMIRNGSTLELALGDLSGPAVKSILAEMKVRPHSAGSHPLLGLELDYIDSAEGMRHCSSRLTAYAEFSNNPDLFNIPADAKVEKMMKIAETALAIEEALKAFDQKNRNMQP